MSLFDALRHRARTLLGGRRHARELDEEVRFHLSLDEMQATRAGASPDEARWAARRRFGNVALVTEETRRASGLATLDGIAQDLRFALRTLRRAPTFAAVAVLTLALGIGTTTAVFSVVSDVLLRPLPYAHDERLSSVYERRADGSLRLASYPTFGDWRAALPRGGPVEDLAFVRGTAITYAGETGPERLTVGYVSPGFFQLLGTRTLRGRALAPDDERANAPGTAVLSHALWQRRFGGDPGVVGRAVTLDGAPVTIVGVMPAGFAYPDWAALWMPIAAIADRDPALARREVHVDSRVIARLAPGADSARAAAAFAALQQRLAEAYPADAEGWTGVSLAPVRDEVTGSTRPMLLALGGAAVLVLLLACANVASLSLVRAAARARELAVRGALGAGRARLARQLLTESLVLAMLGGTIGALGAVSAVGVVRRAAGTLLPRADEIAVDGGVLLFALGVSVLAALLAGTAPALGAAGHARLAALRGGELGSVGGRREGRLRGALVSVQLALAIVLLVGASLLVQSFRRLEAVSLGFEPSGLIATSIDPPQDRYGTPAQAAALYARLAERLHAVPGVSDVAIANHLPLTGASALTPVDIAGQPADAGRVALHRTVSDGYLRTLRVPLVRGRWFSAADMTSPEAAGIVINDAAARAWWPGQDPIGRQITVRRASQARADFGQPMPGTVIGVVGDVRGFGRGTDPRPEIFIPYTREVWPWISLVVRTSGGASAIPALRRAALEVDPSLPVGGDAVRGGFRPMEAQLSDWSAQRRFLTALLGAFAGVALVLAALGVYGVVSYRVAQRTREMGIRLALGAPRASVVRLVMRDAVWLTAVGLAAGLAGALSLTRLLRSLLFETTPADPGAYAATLVVLAGAVLLATWVPARRAVRVDPVRAIRE